MLTHLKPLFAAAIVIVGVALPTTAYARAYDVPTPSTLVPVEPPYTTGAPAMAASAAASSSSSSFEWGDAGIGAGGLLVLMSVGAGAAVAYRRRAGGPATG